MRRTRTRTAFGALVALGGVLLLVGCSAGGDGNSMASAGDTDAGAAAEADAPGTDARQARSGTVQQRAVVSVGSVSLVAEELAPVREQIDRLLGRYGGYVTDEHTVNDRRGDPKRSSLELRVPSEHFDPVMAAFEQFSTVSETDREATDVTTEVIDVDSRVRTQRVSLDRLRAFLGQAEDVRAMIRLEAAIATREATLRSLVAQQKHLRDQTTLATVRVTMERGDAGHAERDDPLAHAGFLTGLRNGWGALVNVLIVGVTVLGAVVPFAVALALLGVPLGWWLRSSRRRRTGEAAAQPAEPG